MAWWSVGRVVVVVALASALCWPVLNTYWFETHEMSDYVIRVVEYATALGRGELYPRWASDFYGGYGSPFFNFYAPLVYWLGGALTLFVGSPTLALKLLILIGSLLAGLATYALLELETKRGDAALVAALLYLAAPYRLSNVGLRGDLAEFFALSLLPLALFSYRRLVHEGDARRLPWLVFQAALAHAALVFSHTLIGLWGTGIVAVVALGSAYQLLRRKANERAWLLLVSFAAALAISAMYTMPALLERAYVRTETMAEGGGYPAYNWLHPSELWSGGAFALGPAIAAAAALTALGSLLRRKHCIAALPWLAGALLFALLTLPHASFVWRADVIPFGRFIQFPWRLLGPAALCTAVAAGLAWAHALPRRATSELMALPFAAAFLVLAVPHTRATAMTAEQLTLSPEGIRSSMISATALDEYLPRAVDKAPKAAAQAITQSSRSMHVEVRSSVGTEHSLCVDAHEAGDLELNLHSFPGWHLKDDGGADRAQLRTSPRGLLMIHFPQAGRYCGAVRFGSTQVRSAALSLSLLGLFGVWPLAYLLVRRRRGFGVRDSFSSSATLGTPS